MGRGRLRIIMLASGGPNCFLQKPTQCLSKLSGTTCTPKTLARYRPPYLLTVFMRLRSPTPAKQAAQAAQVEGIPKKSRILTGSLPNLRRL